MKSVVLISWLAAASACGFDAKFDGHFRCDDDHACPGGAACGADGFCEGGGDEIDAGGPGADSGTDGGGPIECGTTDALRDDWAAQETTDLRWLCGGPIAVADDHLRASLAANQDAYGECVTRRQYRLSGSGLTVKPETTGDDVEAILGVTLPSGVDYRAVLHQGRVRFIRVEGENDDTLVDKPYDAGDDARWRMREADGVLRFETASDAGEFVERASSDQDELPAYVTVHVSGWGPDNRSDDGMVRFGPLNADVATPRCPASSIVDTFTADADNESRWLLTGQDSICTNERAGGVLRIGSVGGLDRCGIASRMGYDLSGDTASIEAVATGDGTPTLVFEVVGADERWYRFKVSGNPPDLTTESGGAGNSSTATVDLSEEDHRFWRFRHDGGSMFWQVSADGDSWTDLHERQGVVEPDDMQIQLYGTSLAAFDPTILQVDNLNATR
ncbi:MAG TPA: hypothetical protein VMZ28_04005 [Kofleriaceae bacterium]|nr:hypothetical protein [Kofleriaceae bacterium]